MMKLNSYNTLWYDQGGSKDFVVLVHGLFRNQNSMSKIAKKLIHEITSDDIKIYLESLASMDAAASTLNCE